MSRYINVRCDVEVDLGDIDTEYLLEELKRRGAGGFDLPHNADTLLSDLHVSLKLGKNERALVLAREVVSASLGVIL